MRVHIPSLQKQIADLKKKRNDLDAAAGDKVMAAAQLAEFQQAGVELAALNTRLEDAMRVEQEDAAVVTPVLDPANPPKPTASAAVEVGDANALKEKGISFARFIAAKTAQKVTGLTPAAWYEKTYGKGDSVHAALSAGDVAAGGATVPTNLAAEIIPLLYAKSVMRKAGVVPVPLVNGRVVIARLKTGSSFQRVGENTDAVATEPTFGSVALTAKKILGVIPISNDLLRYNAVGVDRVILNDAVEGLRVGEDGDFIRGNGVGATPKGARYIAPAATNIFTMTATPDVDKVGTDLKKLMLALAQANVPFDQCGWIGAPRTKLYLQFQNNSNGVRVYPELKDGQLLGFQFYDTTGIPVNLGTGANESELYFMNFGKAVIGDGIDMAIDLSTEASYKNGAGTLISAFSQDQTVARVICANDFGMVVDEAVAVLTGVTWGA